MIDIHTHVLPEVDDGARSWETAVDMCHMAAADAGMPEYLREHCK